MSKVLASITTSVDGYVTGPHDGPEKGLGEGGERLHYWVFGGPWSYDEEPRGEIGDGEKEWMDAIVPRVGAAVAGPHRVRGGGALGWREPLGDPVLHRHAPSRGAAGG